MDELLMEKPGIFDSQYYEPYRSASRIREKGDKPYLYSYWSRYLRGLKPGGRLLDVGCGLGHFLKKIQGKYQAFGVDISGYSVREAKKTALSSDIRVSCATKLPFTTGFFDVVTAFDIVEHLENPEDFFSDARRVLNTGGILVISTPNLDSLGARLKPGNKWAGRKDSTHKSLLPAEKWKSLIEKNGFGIMREGSDFLWDTPYFKVIPKKLQWLIFVGLTWVLVWINGFYPWKLGENYFFVAKKIDDSKGTGR